MSGLHLMNNLLECKDPVMDQPTFKEGKLEGVSQALLDWSQSRSRHLRKDPLDNVDHRNWPKLADVRGPTTLGIRVITPKFRRDMTNVPV